ncbi:MAG: DNA-directed RNA polymerase subunit omega [Kiritimatiellae bacterium]|nr:DNA-directed RNA polymerase subunit omega [Kiritimatiellia bacterium]
MYTNYLNRAKERVPNVLLLINIIGRRIRQLNEGSRPLVKPDAPNMPAMDLALKEVAEGKMTAEINFTPSPVAAPNNNVITL